MHEPQEGYDMESMDNFRERFEALERQTEQLKHETQALKAHTYTVEQQLRWWRGIANLRQWGNRQHSQRHSPLRGPRMAKFTKAKAARQLGLVSSTPWTYGREAAM
jgi:hypothetical protein